MININRSMLHDAMICNAFCSPLVSLSITLYLSTWHQMQFQVSEKDTKSRSSWGIRSNMSRASAQRPASAHISSGTLVLGSRKLQKPFQHENSVLHLQDLYKLPTAIFVSCITASPLYFWMRLKLVTSNISKNPVSWWSFTLLTGTDGSSISDLEGAMEPLTACSETNSTLRLVD